MHTKHHFSTTVLLLLLAWPHAAHTQWTRSRAGYEEEGPSENRFNFFDAELLQSVAYAHPGNIVISPIGVKTVLGMILEGAGSRSADQIRTALRVSERQEVIRRTFENYIFKLKEPTAGIKLEMGSLVFMAQHLIPSHEYASNLNRYDAKIVKVDFGNPENAASKINNWIRDITRGLIPKIIDADNLHPDSQAVLTNAVYFKGRWKIPFEQEATKVSCFFTAPGVCHNTNMMSTLEFFKYSYIRELNADALELPYQGEKFSMLILAPKEIDGVAQLQRDLSHFPVHSIVAALETTEVLVSLPRFEIDFSTDLVPNLQSLGIQDIFGPNSNLTGMFERIENNVGLHVSKVLQKAKIIVNEAGSEAAAGTGALVIPLMGSTISKFQANRPFLFFIRDTTNGITLFAGRVSVPEAASPQYQRPRPQTSTPSSHGEDSKDGTYNGIFTSTTKRPQSGFGGGQNYRPDATRRPTISVGSQGRPTGTSTSTGEGGQISFSSPNSTKLGSSQNSGLLFSNSETQNMPHQTTSQKHKTQSSFSQQEGRPSTQNSKYPQAGVVSQNNDRRILPQINIQQIPSGYSEVLSYLQPNKQPSRIPTPSAPQSPTDSQSWSTTNQNTGLQNSQTIDRQENIRDSSFPIIQTGEKHQSSTQHLKPSFSTQFQTADPPFYSQHNIPGNNWESQQPGVQQFDSPVRNGYPLPQSYDGKVQQPTGGSEDHIVFHDQRKAHSSPRHQSSNSS